MKRHSKSVLITAILAVVSLFSIFPFYTMLCMATRAKSEVYRGEVFTPGTYLWENIKTISESDYARFYFNSLYVAVLATLLTVLVSCMCGYGLAKYRFKGNKPIFYGILATMMVPFQLGLIGFVMWMRILGLNNTHIPLIVQSAAWPFGVFWVRQFAIKGVPDEVLESARLEGCSELRIFFSFGIPFLFPAIASLSMIAFLNSWNAYLLPLLLLTRQNLLTLQVGIMSLGDMFTQDISAQIAGLALGVVPILLIFILGSKYFVRGLTDGAIKG